MIIRDMILKLEECGYSKQDARARVCQDIVLKAISKSAFSNNVTIKGGVLMRDLTKNSRRATQDIDIDFIRYSLSDQAIDLFLQKLNVFPDITIKRISQISELNQQDYKGKSVKILVTDSENTSVQSKIDFGVHKYLQIDQEEYCFEIVSDNKGISLLANSKEQMFAEKIRSLLKFGTFSIRYKDIFDMYFLCDKIDKNKLNDCLAQFVYNDKNMRENSIIEVVQRIQKTFENKQYCDKVDHSDKRWLDESIDEIMKKILDFLFIMQNTFINS